MFRGLKLAALSACLLVAACDGGSATGQYLVSDATGVAKLTLAETKGAVTGQVEAITIGPDGRLKDQISGITGTRDKDLILATVEPAWIGRSMSLRMDGDKVVIDAATPVTLVRSSPDEIAKAVTQLNVRAQQLQVSKQKEADDANARAHQAMMAAADAETAKQDQAIVAEAKIVDDRIARAPGSAETIESAWRSQVARMRSVLEIERAHPGDGQAAVWRSQRFVEITQLKLSLEGAVSAIGGQLEDLAVQSKQKGSQLDAAYSQCQTATDPVLTGACGEVIAEWKRRQLLLANARGPITALVAASRSIESDAASIVAAAQAAT